jgi:hypothetical protein
MVRAQFSGYLAQQPPPQQQVAGPVQALQHAQQAAFGEDFGAGAGVPALTETTREAAAMAAQMSFFMLLV